RDDRLGARVDEDLVTSQTQGIAGAFNFDIPRIDETRVPTDDIQIRGSFQNLLCAISKALDDLLFALPDLSQIHFDATSLHAILACPPGKVGHTRAGGHGLRWSSAVIDAASSHVPLFNDSSLKPRSG